MDNQIKTQTDPKHLSLIIEAQNGSQQAFSRLLEAYTPLIRSLARRFGEATAFHDEEDIEQEGCIAFHSAVMHYDTKRSQIAFGTYARLCIRHRMISYLRELTKHGHTVFLEDSGLSEMSVDAQEDPARRLVEEEAYLELSRCIHDALSDYENKIWRLFLSGRTAKEIAEQMQKDERSVHNAIYRIRKKLRAVIPYS